MVLNGHTYTAAMFIGTDGRGYNDINADTGLRNFPDSIFTDLLAEIAATLVAYDITGFFPGRPMGSEVVLKFVAVRALTLADDFAGSEAKALTAATGAAVFTVNLNGAPVGTITFALGATTATFVTTGAAVALVAGDWLTVVAPAVTDATLDDIAITFKA
ncbi:MAG TPA: hypothetical protein VNA25_08210 [Phycisphaerae bacterium]|nr:hypothetical protein [Phycisphaerae bacterium]